MYEIPCLLLALSFHNAFSNDILYFFIKYAVTKDADLLIPAKQCTNTLVNFLYLSMNSNAYSKC